MEKQKKSPPGRTRIIQALAHLLKTKEFSAITTAEIAKKAGVTEGLIYKYFDDKQELLFQVLYELFISIIKGINKDLDNIDNILDQFQSFILASINSYANNRVFARIILLEVRKSPRFFTSEAYSLVRKYSGILKKILSQGISDGLIKQDISITHLCAMVLGTIEHSCLHGIIFNKEIKAEEITTNLCSIIFDGICKNRKSKTYKL